MRRAEGVLEHLDRPVAAPDREASLADIDRLNAWFGGYRLTLRALERVARRRPASHGLLVIDVGGGRGDFAWRVVRWARRRGERVRVIVVDRDPDLLAIAQRAIPAGVCLVRAEATALPFREASADVVTMSLTLHHMEPDAAVTCLGEMHGVARLAVIVNDLLRARLSLLLVWVATRLVARHPISRHDGPLSVRRAYSPDEMRSLAEKAGVASPRVERYRCLGRVIGVIEAKKAASPR